MPRLSDSERERIIGEIGVGTNVREVANRHNVHVSTVYRLMNRFLQNGDVINRQRSGRPSVTTARQDNVFNVNFAKTHSKQLRLWPERIWELIVGSSVTEL